MQESKSCALPLGDSPKAKGGYRDSNPGPPEPQSGAITNFAIPTILNCTDSRPNEPEGIRTPDPRLRRPLLYPTELLDQLERAMGIEPTTSAWKAEVLPLNYTRNLLSNALCIWSERQDSNLRPPAPKAGALPS